MKYKFKCPECKNEKEISCSVKNIDNICCSVCGSRMHVVPSCPLKGTVVSPIHTGIGDGGNR